LDGKKVETTGASLGGTTGASLGGTTGASVGVGP